MATPWSLSVVCMYSDHLQGTRALDPVTSASSVIQLALLMCAEEDRNLLVAVAPFALQDLTAVPVPSKWHTPDQQYLGPWFLVALMGWHSALEPLA